MQLSACETAAALPWAELINALRAGFLQDCLAPLRTQHRITTSNDAGNGTGGTLLLMPAWIPDDVIGVKQALVFPDNSQQGLPGVNASYQLNCARTGRPLIQLDGNVLTHRRTAAASALAASYLAREDASSLLIVGTGGLAAHMAEAYSQVRSITSVSIWGRNFDKAKQLAEQLKDKGYCCNAEKNLNKAVATHDMISCCTNSNQALVHGKEVRPGTHIDLVGAFTPTMREADDELMRNGSLYVDTREGAFSEAGDILLAIQSGAIKQTDILADLKQLCTNNCLARQTNGEITVFKSVGTAIEDLAAAKLAWRLNSV